MSSVVDNPNIRFADRISALFIFEIITQRNVNTGNYISIEICVMLGHVGARGVQNMQFALRTWMHPRGVHGVSAHSTRIICKRSAESTHICTSLLMFLYQLCSYLCWFFFKCTQFVKVRTKCLKVYTHWDQNEMISEHSCVLKVCKDNAKKC